MEERQCRIRLVVRFLFFLVSFKNFGFSTKKNYVLGAVSYGTQEAIWSWVPPKFLKNIGLGLRMLRLPRRTLSWRRIQIFWKMLLKIGNAQLNVLCTGLLPNKALTQLQINLFLVVSSKFLVLTQLQLTWFLFWLSLIRSCKLAFSRRVGVIQSNLTEPNLTFWPFLQPPPHGPQQFITHSLGWGGDMRR